MKSKNLLVNDIKIENNLNKLVLFSLVSNIYIYKYKSLQHILKSNYTLYIVEIFSFSIYIINISFKNFLYFKSFFIIK